MVDVREWDLPFINSYSKNVHRGVQAPRPAADFAASKTEEENLTVTAKKSKS